MQKITLDAAPRRPWKNGGGVTRELAVAPAGAGLDDFDWRISCAQVASGGPFSPFPGVDRSLAVLAGEGLRLACGDGVTHSLSAGGAPLAFPGELAVSATLLGGPVGDFNVMTRRTRWRHRLERLSLCGERSLAGEADLLLVYGVAGVVACRLADGRVVRLVPGEGVLLEADESAEVVLAAPEAAGMLLGRLWRC